MELEAPRLRVPGTEAVPARSGQMRRPARSFAISSKKLMEREEGEARRNRSGVHAARAQSSAVLIASRA